ncbi:MAG: DUF4349 domain-containing protein [Candidatus Nealsonbacteria bacterium]|nr:DUF4349 domain-containing protein [Candidatus Nealsonbacteria bacterium]
MTLITLKDWIKNHKLVTLVVAGIIVIGFLASIMLVSLGSSRSKSRIAVEETGYADYLGTAKNTPSSMESASGYEIEVKEGLMTIKSKNAEEDFNKIESMAKSYQGYAERSNKSITNLYVQLNLTLRVPLESFTDLVEKLKKGFDVESYNINDYRISIGRELDELQILNQSLSDYEKIRYEINGMNIGKDKIDLLMQLTDKELSLKEREKTYQRMVSSKERQGEYATLNINLKEKKSPTIWPENVLDQFKDRLRNALENTLDILKDLIGGSIEIFFRAIQIATYIIIVGTVVAFFYRLGKILFNLITKKTRRENVD